MSGKVITYAERGSGKELACVGIRYKSVDIDRLKQWSYYAPWMDVLTADRIMQWGPVPYDRLSHATAVHVERGLRELYGHCHHWWKKLGVLFIPGGQLKNFLNAALVCHQVASGSRVAIIGSRYSQGSGDWVKLLADWLDTTGKAMEIHCYDPNEAEGELLVGNVRVLSIAQPVQRSKLRWYQGVVDDVYEPTVGYRFSTSAEPGQIVSYKLQSARTIDDRYYPAFLHNVEARYFNFPSIWEEYPSQCRCQRCRIEQYLGIERWADVIEPSPCREHIPEVWQVSAQWMSRTLGNYLPEEELTPVGLRASIVLGKEEDVVTVREAVDRIVGYGVAETPFKASPVGNPNYATYPTVVFRPGVLLANMGKAITKRPLPGLDTEVRADGWHVGVRQSSRRFLPAGAADIVWGGIKVERKRHIVERDGSILLGAKEVNQWCFLHRCQDDCGLRTDFLPYPICRCGHRHGDVDLTAFGVKCGVQPMDFDVWVAGHRKYEDPGQRYVIACRECRGDPEKLAAYFLGEPGWREAYRPPEFYFVKGRWKHMDWKTISGKQFPMSLARFSKECGDGEDCTEIIAHSSSPVSLKKGRVYWVT